MGQTGSSVLWFVGTNLLVQNHNHYTTAKTIYSVAQERNRGYALLMKAETTLYRAPTFSLLVSHGGNSSCRQLFSCCLYTCTLKLTLRGLHQSAFIHTGF